MAIAELESDVLLVCGSKKPPPEGQSRSAARELLRAVQLGIEEHGRGTTWLDVRDLDLPWFDGRAVEQYHSPDLNRAVEMVEASRSIVFSVPCYWCGPSGVFKNLLDLLGGAAYDQPEDATTPLSGKHAGLLIVGADKASAQASAGGLRETLAAMGAWTTPRELLVPNPRQGPSAAVLVKDAKDFGNYIASVGDNLLVAP
ncbi:MAG: NADPH-dependent FMN reductase [Acidimicrobiales bacterium]